jgi:citrate lyase beta subunit
MSDTSIPDKALSTIVDMLDKSNVATAQRYPGELPARQPVHTVYGGAHLFKADITRKLGAAALNALHEYAPDSGTIAEIVGVSSDLASRIHPRVVEKLTQEPVEDLRIDFEDGFGNRSDDEEDRFAVAAADEMVSSLKAGMLPFGVGIRIKPLNEELKRRSLRTFDLFLTRVVAGTGGALPPNFVVTLAKVTSPAQVAALAAACDAFEYWRELPAGTLRVEVMVETTQSVLAEDGTIAMPGLVAEGGGRIVAAHFGAYDYTASCGITASHQHMLHPACDFARHAMQVALAGTGIWLSDGGTNVLPIPPHRTAAGGSLTAAQYAENAEVVHQAWRLQAKHIRHALVNGFYQGWDLHPAQLPMRYAAVYAFFLEGLETASERLRNFVGKAGQATVVGNVFDDAATGQGLLNYFLRAVNCGAITEEEAVEFSGLTLDELRGRSFLHVLENRTRI